MAGYFSSPAPVPMTKEEAETKRLSDMIRQGIRPPDAPGGPVTPPPRMPQGSEPGMDALLRKQKEAREKVQRMLPGGNP